MNKTFLNFGEYLYYAYANLQMLHYALKADKPKYDRMCYMIRAKAFKAYKEGRWNIHDLFEFNITKIKPKTVIRISHCHTTLRNPNDRFGLKPQERAQKRK